MFMRLPVLPQSHVTDVSTLIRAIKAASFALAQMTSEPPEPALEGATLLLRPDCPQVRCANIACEFDGSETTVQAIVAHDGCLVMDPVPFSLEPSVVEIASEAGFKPVTKRVLAWQYQPRPQHTCETLQIIPARAAYRQLRNLYRQMAQSECRADDKLAEDLASVMIQRLDEPRLDLFMGRLQRQPVALAGVFCLGETGILIPVYTIPSARGQAVGSTLLHHVLEHCKRAQLQQVVLDRTEGCPAMGLYRKAGFEDLGQYQKLVKTPV